MKKIVVFLLLMFVGFGSVSFGQTTSATSPEAKKEAPKCDIKLNTNIPFIGTCVNYQGTTTTAGGQVVNENNVFSFFMTWASKMLMSIILLLSFIALIVAGVMIAASGGSDGGASKGKKLIGNVISALALLGALGVILRLINPNFFK